METAKIFDGKYGKTVKVKFELEFYLPENEDGEQVEIMSINEVKEMIGDEDRTELGEKVLNSLNIAVVVTE